MNLIEKHCQANVFLLLQKENDNNWMTMYLFNRVYSLFWFDAAQ